MNRKKIAAGFISFALMMQSCVFAVSAAEENKTANFEYDDFSVSYSVTNSYGNTEVVSLTLTNTGNETIEDWMLYFEPNGDIQYVTNATEMTAENGKMYFKNNGYNADIAPSSAVTFTYAVNDCTEIPDYYALCQTRVEKTEDYDVSLSVGESWGDSFNGSIVITNHTDKPIEAWELSIDTNFTITKISNSWAATVTELDEYQYLLKGTYTSTIAANSSVSLGFIGTKNGTPEIESYSLTEVKMDSSKMVKQSIRLRSDCCEFLTSEEGVVYFYAKPNYSITGSLYLKDANTDEIVATMYDDGNYDEHGDDLEKDGTYSCVISINNSSEGTLQYYAVNGSITSQPQEIVVYEDIDDESIDEMMEVNGKLNEMKDSTGYMNATTSEKQQMFFDLMQVLSVTGTDNYAYSLVDFDSISFNNGTYSFYYTCGLIGYFELENPEYAGVSNELSDMEDSTDYLALDDQETSQQISASYLGTGHIVFEFNPDTDTNFYFQYSTFQKYADTWTAMGMNTDVYSDVYTENPTYDNSLEDLKHLQEYDYIVIAGHGRNWGNGTISIKTHVVNNNASYARYKKDIRSGRLIAYPDFFRVTNRFFEFYYDESELTGKVFYLYSCSNFGNNDKIDYSFYDSLHSAGAETVVGFCNDLWTSYSDEMIRAFTEGMLNGYTAGEAMSNAEGQYTPKHGEIPVVAGNVNKSWANITVKNGDFESNDSSPRYWNYSGDVRILDSLGNYVHNNNLLFMSTGIGSKSDYNSSQVSQVFHIPENATTLTFSYNFISEEPMEWVGDEYDDEFLTNIYAGTSTSTVLRESTNTSTWHRTNITNFYGGDNTMYETQWKTVTIDVEQYAGKAIKLEFNVNNVGDNTYNSVVLIDNVLVA